MVSFLMGALALTPGLPFLPFALFSAASGYAAWKMTRSAQERAARERIEAAQAEAAQAPTEEPIARTLAIDTVRIEIG